MTLRDVETGDLDHFFEQQSDPEASALAGVPMRDRASFDLRWSEIVNDRTIVIRTIEADGEIAGYVFSFQFEGELRIGYWLGRGFWGRGIASGAVAEFLERETRRPLFATVHPDNAASIRILEKNGFETTEADAVAGLRYILR